MPALMHLYTSGKLSQSSTFVAFSRREWQDSDYHTFIKPSLEKSQADLHVVGQFLKRVIYVKGTFDESASYTKLKEIIKEKEALYHLAIQPEFYETVFNELGKAGLHHEQAKIIIEKPFGHDHTSAKKLEKTLGKYFTEEQTYRIDHYLGKQGLIDLIEERKKDTELENMLNAEHIGRIEATMFEDIDIKGRGEFYERIGALRDVGQNHVLEMLAAVVMEIPKSVEEGPQARAEVLHKLKKLTAERKHQIERAQYEEYRSEQDVQLQSDAETYFKVQTEIESYRWAGVEIVLQAGKAMPKKVSNVIITFKDGNQKTFEIRDGARDAYEILIEKAILGDKVFFVSIDEVLASWEFIDSVRAQFENIELKFYKKGNTP